LYRKLFFCLCVEGIQNSLWASFILVITMPV
jgi:hypothetical protein